MNRELCWLNWARNDLNSKRNDTSFTFALLSSINCHERRRRETNVSCELGKRNNTKQMQSRNIHVPGRLVDSNYSKQQYWLGKGTSCAVTCGKIKKGLELKYTCYIGEDMWYFPNSSGSKSSVTIIMTVRSKWGKRHSTQEKRLMLKGSVNAILLAHLHAFHNYFLPSVDWKSLSSFVVLYYIFHEVSNNLHFLENYLQWNILSCS